MLLIYSVALMLGWTGAIVTSLYWNLHLFRQETERIALNVARTQVEAEIINRRWNALHGGVYVPVTPESQPDPALADIAERDATTSGGRPLTLNSHVRMSQQVQDLILKKQNVKGRSMSLSVLEKGIPLSDGGPSVLSRFQRGEKEVSFITMHDGVEYSHLIVPFLVEESCLGCHARQGYKPGDIRGAITVTVPLAPVGGTFEQHISSLWIGHALWWLLGGLGILISYFGIHQHTEKRKQAEDALKRLQRQQDRILNAAGEGICGVDADGVIDFMNPVAAAMFGWESDSLVGKKFRDVVCLGAETTDPEYRFACSLPESFSSAAVKLADETFFHRKNGTTFPVEYISTPIVEDGVIIGAVLTFADISVRREAEQEMGRMRFYLQNVIDSMPSILISIDIEGRITRWNNEARRVTGFDILNTRDRKLSEVLPVFAEYMDRIRHTMIERKPLRLERLPFKLQADSRFVDVMIFPLVYGDVEEAAIRIDDVTERVLVEDETIQNEKLMSVTSLVEGIAHELNNPLGGILQGAQSVIRRVSLDLPQNIDTARKIGVDLEKIQVYLKERNIIKFLDGIRSSGHRAANIVAYMLQFSRDRVASREHANISALIDRAVELVNHDSEFIKTVNFEEIEIVREYEENLPLAFCAVSEIEQVMVNLLKNAGQVLMAQKNTVPPRITLRALKDVENDMVRIEVEDNGPGMEEHIQRRVFEPFFTTKPPGEGTGLGLAVSYFMVTVTNKGAMSVESTPGAGAKFILRLRSDRGTESTSQ